MWHIAFGIALGIFIVIGVVLTLYVIFAGAVAAYVFLWAGIDDYGPLKHWWLDKRGHWR